MTRISTLATFVIAWVAVVVAVVTSRLVAVVDVVSMLVAVVVTDWRLLYPTK
jgi:low affinity Fe/Cu permease